VYILNCGNDGNIFRVYVNLVSIYNSLSKLLVTELDRNRNIKLSKREKSQIYIDNCDICTDMFSSRLKKTYIVKD